MKIEMLDEFDVLYGFSFVEAYETMAENNDNTFSNVIVFKFANTKNVAIDVVFVDGEYHIEEPYAVDDNYVPLRKEVK